MADFCKQCSIENFGEDFGDFKTSEPLEEGFGYWVLCEGCGAALVTQDGTCISEVCDKKHGVKNDG
jgi:hypothetical protein